MIVADFRRVVSLNVTVPAPSYEILNCPIFIVPEGVVATLPVADILVDVKVPLTVKLADFTAVPMTVSMLDLYRRLMMKESNLFVIIPTYLNNLSIDILSLKFQL